MFLDVTSAAQLRFLKTATEQLLFKRILITDGHLSTTKGLHRSICRTANIAATKLEDQTNSDYRNATHFQVVINLKRTLQFCGSIGNAWFLVKINE